MNLRTRLRRVADRLEPPPEPLPKLTPEERIKRLEWWVSEQTRHGGVFDTDPEFREAWVHYHRLWEIHTGGYSPWPPFGFNGSSPTSRTRDGAW